MEQKYSIRWNDLQGMGFWLRGIKPDGSFYGELEYAYGDPARCAGTFVEGHITAEDWTECQIQQEDTQPPNPSYRREARLRLFCAVGPRTE